MNAYRELKARQQEEFNHFPMFAAFNDGQFQEGLKRLGLDPESAEAAYSIGGGCFIRKSDIGAYTEMLEKQHRELHGAISADRKGDGFIFDMFLAELENHEYSYTGDASDAVFACGLTWEQIINNKPLLTGLKKAMKAAAEYYN